MSEHGLYLSHTFHCYLSELFSRCCILATTSKGDSSLCILKVRVFAFELNTVQI